MLSKRDLLASGFGFTGITRLLALLPTKPVLLVLNYHRVGDAAASPYDSGVFSCTGEELDEQVRYVKRRLHLATLDEAIEMVEGRRRPRGTSALLTFDDGYLDNFATAFPILASHGVQGVFFLPTGFVGSARIPWWDTIAYLVKRCTAPVLRLTHPSEHAFDLRGEPRDRVVERVLWVFKNEATEGPERFIAALEEATDVERPDASDRLFLDWTEAATMLRGGMAIGGHTHSHEILATLPADRQREELATSKRILEERLATPIRAMSYPVGFPHTFSAETRSAAAETGFDVAFSFYGGFNPYGAVDRYDVRRFAVNATLPRFRLQTAVAATTGKYWL